MKLRLQANSIRLRLKQGEVARLVKTGRLEEKIVFSSQPERALTYVLETVDSAAAPQAALDDATLHVRISTRAARQWAEGDGVGIEEHQPLAGGQSLHIIIEKDFACLDRSEAENADTYPHPLAGKA